MNAIKKKSAVPNITGSHQMTWKELAEADDLASSLTVDPYLGFTTHKMTDMKLRIPDRIKRKFRDIICNFQQHKCYDTAYRQLTADSNIVRRSWSVDPRFKEHVNRYLLLFDDRSGIEIRPCWRYASENHMGAAIFATKDWTKGSRISTLVGCIAELKHHEEAAFLKHHKNDFSVMYSSRKNCSQLWLGPAAYVNHDCQPNCEFTINCDVDARMSLEAKTDIKPGDEIFIYYGTHFFDTNNGACECFTCELLGRGYFSKFTQGIDNTNVSDHKPVSNLINEHENDTSSYHKDRYSPNGHCHILRDRVNSIPDNPQPTCNDKQNALDFFLKKGSSTGLACKSLPNAYALRHTGSRLNRVKARLIASTIASINKSFDIHSLENKKPKIKSPHKKCILRRRIPNIIPSCKRNSSNSHPYTTGRREPKNSLAVMKNRHILSGNLSDHGMVCDGISWQESDATSSGLGQSVHNDSSGSNSPLPPDLDRMSSTSSSNSFNETLVTPDLESSYYLEPAVQMCIENAKVKQSTTSINNQPSADKSSVSIVSPLRTTENELAKNVEPILGRLMHETKRNIDIKNSLTAKCPSNQSSISENVRKRLTNYDARLIAEASLLTPLSKQRQRKPLSYPDSVEYVSFRNTMKPYSKKSLKCKNKSGISTKKSHSNKNQAKNAITASKSSNNVYNSRSASSYFVGNKFIAVAETQYRTTPDQYLDIASEDPIPPLLTSPSKLHTASSFTLSDSSHDVGPPSIYSTAEADDRSELFSIDSELTEPNLDIESSCDYLVRDMPIVPFGLLNKSITYDVKSPVLSAEHIFMDHDYSLLPYNSKCTLVSSPLLKKKMNTEDCQQKTVKNPLPNSRYNTYLPNVVHTPPPPLLQPETSPNTFDFYAHDSLCKTKNYFLSNPSHTPTVSHVHNSWWPRTSDTKDIWQPDVLFSHSTSPDSRRLTVTLKRIGPKHYQISQPNRLFIN
ncbi:Histone-lysine N-methyltransferase KMT5B [Schistosoma japonicum]|nr:Histone-lysine N-methyltransferase KMT5B [Schistosoma japonicum]